MHKYLTPAGLRTLGHDLLISSLIHLSERDLLDVAMSHSKRKIILFYNVKMFEPWYPYETLYWFLRSVYGLMQFLKGHTTNFTQNIYLHTHTVLHWLWKQLHTVVCGSGKAIQISTTTDFFFFSSVQHLCSLNQQLKLIDYQNLW